MDSFGELNQVKQALGTEDASVVHTFETSIGNRTLDLRLLDAGPTSGDDRYTAEVFEDGEKLATAGPERDIATVVRNVYSKASSRFAT